MKNKNIKELKKKNTRDLETTTAAILRAALELGEELGFEGLTVEGIAARSGIAKTTIYRRWPNVGAIVMDAFLADVTRLGDTIHISQRGFDRDDSQTFETLEIVSEWNRLLVALDRLQASAECGVRNTE